MRILLVEDDPSLQRTLTKLFKSQDYTVDPTGQGKEAGFLAMTNDYDVIVLDLMLPDIDGFEVCARVRSANVSTPILMLTALDDREHTIRGLDTGADDYLPKPFHAGELLARVRALSRRNTGEKTSVLKAADLTFDLATHRIRRGGRDLDLSAKEKGVLQYLMQNKEKVVTREQLAEHVWDMNFDPRSNVIDAFIKLLRKKIDNGCETKLIRTVRGIGYKLSEGDPG